ncbi:Gfo/Idh/MocA family protein [Paenibacillus sepulcri]
MDNQIKAAIIGAGGIATVAHAPAWTANREAVITAVCDINREKAERFAEKYGIAEIYTDYRELLEKADIDVVDICTPNLYHSEIAVAALNAGKHVFCEKPDAISPQEAQKMADAAARSGRTLMTMRNNRFSAATQFMKKYIEEGNMGEIYTGRCGWLRRRGIPGKGGWFTTKELSGGGSLIDLGVHFIDVAVWLMGNPKPTAVSGAVYTKFADNTLSDSVHSQFGEKRDDGTFDVEDLATGFIRFDNGATLQIEFSWASNVEEECNFYELRGTKAGAAFKNGKLKLFTEIAGTVSDVSPSLPGKGMNDHASHLFHFVDVLKGRAEPIILPEHGVDMIKILSAIYESAKQNKEIQL